MFDKNKTAYTTMDPIFRNRYHLIFNTAARQRWQTSSK